VFLFIFKLIKLLESGNRIKKSFFIQKIQLGKVTCLFQKIWWRHMVTIGFQHDLITSFFEGFTPNLKFLA